MATIRISKPAAGQTNSIQAEAGQTLQLNFPTDQAFPERVGNDLVFRFQDGSATRLTGFFTEFTRETLPDFVLNDRTELSGEDFFTAINPDLLPAGGGSSGGAGDYQDDAGSLIGRLSALDPLRPVFWGRDSEVPEEGAGILSNLTVTPSEDPGMIIVPSNVNESDGAFYLILNLDRPAAGEITVVLHVGGNVDILQNIGLDNEFRADVSLANGVNYSYDPATGNLTITIPAGVTQVAVPVTLVDDHVNDGSKQITFEIVDLAGPVTGDVGTVTTVDISEDNRSTHDHGGDERFVLDGPIVGIAVAGDSPAALYEGQPQDGGEANHFTFQITLKDPHTGGDYDGYKGDGLMSQDMTVTLSVGGDAQGGDASQAGGADFHLMPSAELQGLIDSGAVSVALNPDGSIALNSDGTFNITLNGRVDTDGSGGAVFNLDTDLSKLTIKVVPHINGDKGAAGEGAERITIGVDGVVGNEGQPADGEPVLIGTITDDPILNIDIKQDSVNESADGFALVLDFDKELDPGVEVRIVFRPGGTAVLGLDGADDSYKVDYFLPEVDGTLGQSITMNADGTFTLTLHGSDFVLNPVTGKYEINLNVPVNDDHITETGDETVTLTVNSVTLTDANGVYSGDVGGLNSNDGTIITEDTEYNNRDGDSDLLEKDGPIISVTVDGDSANVHGTETELKADGEHFFQINLTDPRTGADYAGFTGDAAGVLSQDINLVLNIGGEALRGADYTLDLDFLNALQDEGMLSFRGPDDFGNISITLFGLTGPANADGTLDPSAGNTPFDLGRLADLKIGVNIIDDTETERAAEKITVTISSPDGDNIGNESQIGAGASLTIDADKESQFNGPVLNLVSDARVNESADDDTAYATADNTARHSITLDKAGTEDIKVLISLTGKDGAVLFDGTNADSADFSWADKLVAIDANGNIMLDDQGNPLVVSCVDNGDGTYTITIPEGALRVDFDVTIIDDLRETTEGAEKYEVTLELVKTGGLADGEATLAGGASSITKDTAIDPDLRDAAGNGTPLNPTNFDGPFVKLTVDANTIYESAKNPGGSMDDAAGRPTGATFTINLLDPSHAPDGASSPFTDTTESVRVTMSIGGDDASWKLSDLNLAGAVKQSDGTWTLKIALSDPNDPNWSGQATLTIAADGRGATLVADIPAGRSAVSFSLDALDDYYGGNKTTTNDGANESFTVTITDLLGNEARLDDQDAHGKQTVTVVDDKSAAADLHGNLDGPRVSVALAGAGDGVTEGKAYKLNLSLLNETGGGFKIDPDKLAYDSAYKNAAQNGQLQEDLTVVLKIGGSVEYGVDFTITNLPSGVTITGYNAATGELTLKFAAGTTIPTGGTFSAAINIINDANTETGGRPGETYGKGLGWALDTDTNSSTYGKLIPVDAGGNPATAGKETLSITVDSVSGHESVVGTGTGAAITDADYFKLGISAAAPEVKEGEDIKYTLTLYPSGGGNTPSTLSQINAANGSKGLLQDTLVQILFTGDASYVYHGSETAPGTVDMDYDLSRIAAAFAAANPGYGVLDVIYDAAQGGYVVTFSIPAAEWKGGSDGAGKASFNVPTITDTIFEDRETVTATIKDVKGNDIGIHTGKDHVDVDIVDNTAAEGFGPVIGIDGTPVIYEDPAHGKDVEGTDDNAEGVAWNTARYTVSVTPPDYEQNPNNPYGDGQVDEGFYFTVKLENGPGSNGATFGDIRGGGDFNWALNLNEDGTAKYDFSDADDRAAFIADVNDFFHDTLGLPAGVYATGVSADGKSIELHVDKGVDYDDIVDQIKLDVAAVDDNITENKERYGIVITKPSQEGQVIIDGDHNRANTDILDDSGAKGHQNGFQVAARDAVVNESERYVEIPIQLYRAGGELLEVSTQPGQGLIPFTVGSATYYISGTDYYSLTQNMTISLTFGDGSANGWATGNKDFDANKTVYTLSPSDWKVVEVDGQLVLQAVAKVEITDDHLSEGTEKFTATVDGVTGNESFPYEGGDKVANINITDDTIFADADAPMKDGQRGAWQRDGDGNLVLDNNGDKIAVYKGVMDGPFLKSFMAGVIEEPTPGVSTDYRLGTYTITLTDAASEKIVVFLDLSATATEGVDFRLGDNIRSFTVADDGAVIYDGQSYDSIAAFWKAIEGKGAAPDTLSAGKHYFAEIPAGQASAKFTLEILHDNDTSANSRGHDQSDPTDTTGVDFTIVDMKGSEVNFDPANPPTNAGLDSNILDDMMGPEVSITSVVWSHGVPTVTVDLTTAEGAVAEDVYVTLNVYGMDGELKGYFKLTVAELGDTGTLALTPGNFHSLNGGSMPNGDFYLQIAGNKDVNYATEGGETRHDPSFFFADAPGGSGGPGVSIDGFTATNIAEGGDKVEYTFDLGGLTPGNIPKGISFDLKIMNGTAEKTSDLQDHDGLHVELTKKDLKTIADNGGKFTIRDDGHGGIEIVIPGKGPGGTDLVLNQGSHVDGKLPSALDDDVIEGTENFNTIITNPSGVDLNAGAAKTDVEDRTYFKLLIVADGPLTEGDPTHTFTAMLVRTDEFGNIQYDSSGKPIPVETGRALEFVLSGDDGTATKGADYVIMQDRIRIEPGSSSATFQVELPNDYKTELEDATFGIKADLAPETTFSVPGLAGNYAKDGETSGGSFSVHDDYIDNNDGTIAYPGGASISLEAVESSVTEGAGGPAHFIIRTTMVPEEEVKITLQIDPDSMEHIKFVEHDGNRYIQINDNGVIKEALVNADGTFTVTLNPGQSQITVLTDVLDNMKSDSGATITLSIVETHGGETEGNFDKNAHAVDVKDNMNGPLLTLVPLDVNGNPAAGASSNVGEDAGHVQFKVDLGINGTSHQAAQEDITINLKLSEDWQKAARGGDTVEYSLDGGDTWTTVTVNANGTFSITNPAGNAIAPLIRVAVNDSGTAEGSLPISLSFNGNPVGGEASLGGAPHFEPIRTGETGDSINFEVASSSSSSSTDTVVAVTLGHVTLAQLKSVTLYGTTFNPANPPAGITVTESNGNVIISRVIPAGGSLNPAGDDLVLRFNGDTATVNAIKDSLTVTVAGSGQATLNVTDETTSTDLDGPVASLAFASASVAEGDAIVGVLHVRFPNLAGDADSNGDFHTAEKLTLTLQLSKNPDGTYSPVTLDSGSPYTISAPDTNGKVTITIPAGSAIPADGDLGINLNINVPDNSLAANPDLNVTITGITGDTSAGATQHYETMGIDQDNKNVSIDVTDNAVDSGPSFTVTAGAEVTEGGTATFTISSTDAMWKQVPNGETVMATIKLTGLVEGDVVKVGNTSYAVDGNGEITVPLTHANGSDKANVTVTVVTDDLTEGEGRSITATVVGVDTFETLGGSTSGTVDVTTNDGIELGLSVAPDSSEPSQLTYTIMLSALGGYAPVSGLTEPLSFQLTLDGMTDVQKADVATQLTGTGYSAEFDQGVVTVTLAEGYNLANDTLAFNVTPHTDYSSADTNIVDAYNVTLTPLANTGGELNLEVDPDADSARTVHNLTITGTDGNDAIHGGAGDDTIYAGSGDDVIYGGLGNDTMHSGTGHDTFAWGSGDYDNGTDTVVGFTLGEDHLSFADIFGNDPLADDTAIVNALDAGSFTVSASADGSQVTFTMDHAGGTQTVHIEMAADSHLSNAQVADLNSGNVETQAAVLHQMLTNIGG